MLWAKRNKHRQNKLKLGTTEDTSNHLLTTCDGSALAKAAIVFNVSTTISPADVTNTADSMSGTWRRTCFWVENDLCKLSNQHFILISSFLQYDVHQESYTRTTE